MGEKVPRRLITFMPEPIQAQMAAKVQRAPDKWPQEARDKYAAVLAAYDGPAQPYGKQLYRPRPAD